MYNDFGLVINYASNPATVQAKALDMSDISGFSITAKWGVVTGALKVQARDHELLDWSDVTDIVLPAPAGSASAFTYVVGNARSKFYRVVYTHTSGTGLLQVAVFAKSDG